MTRAWIKILLVLCGLLGVTSGFGQGVVLKKLYDGIEDMRLEVEQRSKPVPGEFVDPYKRESTFLRTLLQKKFEPCEFPDDSGKMTRLRDASGSFVKPDISIRKAINGSFTKPSSSQKLYRTGFGCDMPWIGIAIVQGDKSIAFYDTSSYIYDIFSVKDLNQNGLNEVMLVLQSKAKAPWDEMLAVQLLEFPNAKPVSVGSFFVGGPANSYADGGDFMTCSQQAPRELQKFFPSNIIYVQKGRVPRFFAEGWEINCDYLEKGVKARKVSSLTPIKPVPRAVSLTRLF
jgi:hypothetical protein